MFFTHLTYRIVSILLFVHISQGRRARNLARLSGQVKPGDMMLVGCPFIRTNENRENMRGDAKIKVYQVAGETDIETANFVFNLEDLTLDDNTVSVNLNHGYSNRHCYSATDVTTLKTFSYQTLPG